MAAGPSSGPALAAEGSGGDRADVVVVGGGVSGCACAATLAEHGLSVLVISSALDVIGLPGYGPELGGTSADWARVAETLGRLAGPLRSAWASAAFVSERGPELPIVDRRAVSIETKRALEKMPGLGFRQGLVTSIRLLEPADAREGPSAAASPLAPAPPNPAESKADASSKAGAQVQSLGRVEVETAFGEVFAAPVVVLAPGLALGGEVEIGEQVVPGGRYGEVAAGALRTALEALGLVFRPVTLEVDERFGGSAASEVLRRAEERGVAVDVVSLRGRLAGVPGQGYRATNSDNEHGGARRGNAGSEPDASESHAFEALRQLLEVERESGGRGREGDPAREAAWPDEYPTAPHWSPELRAGLRVLAPGCDPRARGGSLPHGARSSPDDPQPFADATTPLERASILPDGVATGEYCLHVPENSIGQPSDEAYGTMVGPAQPAGLGPGGAQVEAGVGAGECSALFSRDPATRLAYTVRGWVVDTGPGGAPSKELEGRVWVIGRAAGAADYLESLTTGVRAAEAIVDELLRQEMPEGASSSGGDA